MAKHLPPLLILAPLLTTLALLPTPSSGTNVLFSGSGNILKTAHSLEYKQYSLVMQKDCNLVLHSSGKPIWDTGTAHAATSCYLQLLSNGELVLFGRKCSSAVPVWRSNTTSVGGGYALVLQYDGSLRVYGPTKWSAPTETQAGSSVPATAASTTVDPVLYTADVAPIGTTIVNGVYELVLRDDCNLTLSDTSSGAVLWQTGTNNWLHNCFVTLEATGELKIKYMGGETMWSNGAPSGYGEYVLALAPEGGLSVYGPSVWTAPKAAGAASTVAAGKNAVLSEE